MIIIYSMYYYLIIIINILKFIVSKILILSNLQHFFRCNISLYPTKGRLCQAVDDWCWPLFSRLD